MRRFLVIALAVVGLTAMPSLSSAGPVKDLVRSTVLSVGTTVASVTDEQLVGVTWTSGDATVRYRWLTAHGWTGWKTADEDTADVGIPGTVPLWRPAGGVAVQLAVTGDARGLRLARVTDGVASRVFGGVAHASLGRALLGEVQSRADWGADESMVRRAPSYASSVKAVVVHHTDDLNGYAPADVPRIIRADYSYHVKTRGWPDLGYNLLVDSYGRVWEGRRGGLGRATVGTHAQGFNTGTLGVSMIGDMTKTHATVAAQKAFARVIAYAAATWHFDPRGTVQLRSNGSPRYPDGRVVTLHRVFGHGETGITDCPGSLQQDLPYLRDLAVVAARPAPRILRADLSGAPVHAPDPVVLDARLSASVKWHATFSDSSGAVVAQAFGHSTAPRLAWDGRTGGPLPAAPGTYTWVLHADDGFHDDVHRSGTFDVALPHLTALL